jgi:tetratricopeptide (TPR) repeat protein
VKRIVATCLVALGLAATTAAFAADTKSVTTPAAVDSLALLEKAVAKDSTKFDNLYRLGVMYMERERMSEASRVFAKADQVKPNNIKVLVNLGISADALGHADVAQEWYAKALVVAPDDSIAMCRMASSKYAQGKYDEAMGLLRELIKKKPGSYCAYFTLGVSFADAGLYRDAIRQWRKVVELAPDSPEAVSAKESIDVLEKFLQGK